MPHDSSSDLQEAFHLMEYFLQDLHQAIIQQELYNFSEVPPLYTAMYPPASATSGRGSDRNKHKDEATTGNQNGDSSVGGSGGANKGGHDLRNSCSTNGDSRNTNSDKSDKDKGIFICERMPYFKSMDKPDGALHPPKVTVDGKETIICMKGSSKDRACTSSRCKFAHTFTLEKITKGVSALNT